MRERRDPGALGLDSLRRLCRQSADKASTATLNSEVWIQNRVLWFPYAGLGNTFNIVLGVFHGVTRLKVVLERPHEELRRQFVPTLVFTRRPF